MLAGGPASGGRRAPFHSGGSSGRYGFPCDLPERRLVIIDLRGIGLADFVVDVIEVIALEIVDIGFAVDVVALVVDAVGVADLGIEILVARVVTGLGHG